MDFIAHLLWSTIIFVGPQVVLAAFFGVMPDLVPFGLEILVRRWRNPPGIRQQVGMLAFYDLPQNRWVFRLYCWTHSLVMWGLTFGIFVGIWAVGWVDFPVFLFAWFIHICVDIPTHQKVFFAPAFLTPLSKYRYDGKSWAHPTFMKVNYTLILAGIVFRVVQFICGR